MVRVVVEKGTKGCPREVLALCLRGLSGDKEAVQIMEYISVEV